MLQIPVRGILHMSWALLIRTETSTTVEVDHQRFVPRAFDAVRQPGAVQVNILHIESVVLYRHGTAR